MAVLQKKEINSKKIGLIIGLVILGLLVLTVVGIGWWRARVESEANLNSAIDLNQIAPPRAPLVWQFFGSGQNLAANPKFQTLRRYLEPLNLKDIAVGHQNIFKNLNQPQP